MTSGARPRNVADYLPAMAAERFLKVAMAAAGLELTARSRARADHQRTRW